MSYTAPADTSPGSFLEKPGSYHFFVTSITEKPTIDGEIKDQIHLRCQVLAGNEPSEVNKTINIRLNLPAAHHADGGDFANRVLFRMARALCLLPSDIKPGQTVDDPIWKNGESGQFIADIILTESQKKDGKKYAGIDAVKIFHVDDTDRKSIPRSEDHISLLPSEKRLEGKGPAAAPVSQSQSASPSPSTPPVSSAVEDFSDV